MGKRVSAEDKQRAQALFAIGKSYRDIGKEIGASAASVSNWARDEGWLKGVLPEKLLGPDTPQVYESANATVEERATNTDKLAEAVRRRWVDHKSELADEFGEKIRELLDRAFAPCVLKEVKVVAGPQGAGSAVEIVEIPLSLPPPADQVKLLTGVAILVDKASLLVGDATSRTETSALQPGQLKDRLGHVADEVAARREKAEADAAKREAEGQTG
jgi:hypothetical protein